MPPPFISTFTTFPAPSPTHSFGHVYKPPLLDPTHQYALRQLRQTGSVSDYQVQFETISLRVLCMSAEDHRDCFTAGLREDIRRELTLLQPHYLSQAIRLAKKIEAKLLASKPSGEFIPWTGSFSAVQSHDSPQLSCTNFNISKPSDDISFASFHATVETNPHAVKHVAETVPSTEFPADGSNPSTMVDRKESVPKIFKDLELSIPVLVRSKRVPSSFENHSANHNLDLVPSFVDVVSSVNPNPQPFLSNLDSPPPKERKRSPPVTEHCVGALPTVLTPTMTPPLVPLLSNPPNFVRRARVEESSLQTPPKRVSSPAKLRDAEVFSRTCISVPAPDAMRSCREQQLIDFSSNTLDGPPPNSWLSLLALRIMRCLVDRNIILTGCSGVVHRTETRVGARFGKSYGISWCAVENFARSGVILRLLRQLVSFNPCHGGRTRLHHTILYGNVEAVRILIKCHSNVEFPVKTTSKTEFLRIHLASRFGLPTIIQCLIDFGCDLDSLTDFGDNTLMICAEYMHVQCLKILTRVGTDFGLVAIAGQSTCSIAEPNEWSLSLQQAVMDVIGKRKVPKCENRGCVPSKTLLAISCHMQELKSSHLLKSLGLHVYVAGYDRQGIADHTTKLASPIRINLPNSLKTLRVDILTGFGTVWGPQNVQVGSSNSIVTATDIFIATGYVPFVPKGVKVYVWTAIPSDHALKLESVPAWLSMVGNGYIDLEFGNVYNTALGSKGIFIGALDHSNYKPVLIELIDAKTKEHVLVGSPTPISGYTCIGIVAIRDPVHPCVHESVAICRSVGITFRMVTGDNINTVTPIATKCGTLTDGLTSITGVIVTAATNIPEILDLALLRLGRCDRQVAVELPPYGVFVFDPGGTTFLKTFPNFNLEGKVDLEGRSNDTIVKSPRIDTEGPGPEETLEPILGSWLLLESFSHMFCNVCHLLILLAYSLFCYFSFSLHCTLGLSSG